MEWNWIIQTATMLGIGAIGYFLKTTMAELKTQINKNAQDVDELKKELDDLRSDLPFIYTTREDFIRTMNNVDKKLDKIHDSMLEDRGRWMNKPITVCNIIKRFGAISCARSQKDITIRSYAGNWSMSWSTMA
ncbi:hypothetical protein WJ0W_007016 [Paenibacillus melissococcoides]|uniref:Uncharacterized protein n=1 Tax=Paenibacillus melissococcoides TaxID=2912268 RepID=A0ABM9GCZ8_9BACL|nr:hypothetical protein WJ0W_006781 [Paenibacillus melissococcoides]CAH8249832.1 hypothetical protein WJ0W_007016 [Paenibacillus melissococcoides]